jgi:uncharacterized protein (UPF0548 family)
VDISRFDGVEWSGTKTADCGGLAFAAQRADLALAFDSRTATVNSRPKEIRRVFCVTKPNPQEIRDFYDRLPHSKLSYQEIGATSSRIPINATLDHNRIRLGQGVAAWNKATEAVRAWRMFDLGWTENAPIEAGTNVAVLIHHIGFYSLNASRIVYVVDDPTRFGFAYGTLREHAESGEERFLVERDLRDGSVYYDLLAFSHPAHPLARFGYPITRALQKRFAADSKARMLRAVA